MEVSEKSLSSLLNNCDVAYTSSTTSAAVDAYLFNIDLVTVLDLKHLNMSPLLGFTDVNYISSAEELISFLNKFLTLKKRNNLVKEYFSRFFIIEMEKYRFFKIIMNYPEKIFKF